MKFLRRWLSLRYHLRVRRWRARAIKAERGLAHLRFQLNAEMYRNRSREDALITVPMRLGGLYGMAPREGPATPKFSPKPKSNAAADPWDNLTWSEREEYNLIYKDDAEKAGLSQAQARQYFLEVLAERKQPLNDDPFAH